MVLVKDKRIPVLPNLVTTAGIFAGFYSVIHAIQGDYRKAAWAIVIAGVFDLLDGRIARMMKAQSEFGVQYDSLSDLCSFGFAPALLAYFWGLQSFGRLGWLASFVYVVCTALRLARFNVQGSSKETDYFQGIPSPGGAAVILGAVLLDQEFGGGGHLTLLPMRIAFLVLVFFTALLMVSGVRLHFQERKAAQRATLHGACYRGVVDNAHYAQPRVHNIPDGLYVFQQRHYRNDFLPA